MAANKSVWNGVLIGMIAAIALYYIATTIAALSFVVTFFTYLSNSIFGAWPSLASVGTTIMSYILVSIIGILIGLYVEYQ